MKRLRLLSARIIGYVGRKDYSLYTPLKWFERLAENNPDIFGEEKVYYFSISLNMPL